MLILKINRILRNGVKNAKYLSTQIQPQSNVVESTGGGGADEAASELQLNDGEYTKNPEYPEILDTTYLARKFRQRLSWHDEVKNLKTVEEKLIKINMPRYYGYRTVSLESDYFPYNCLPLTQHYTRTCFEEVEKFPQFYEKNDGLVNSFLESIKAEIEDCFQHVILYFNQKYGDNKELTPQDKDKLLGALIVEELNRTLITSLLADCQHLSEVEIDLDPRHEAFWFVGGVNPPKAIKKLRKSVSWQKEYANDPVDRAVQYFGKPYLLLRHRLPLEPINSEDAGKMEEQRAKVPLYKYDARTLGYTTVHRHGTNIPGFWPGSPHEFGLLSYYPRDFLVKRDPKFGSIDEKEALHSLGIQSSFAWLLAQACYQGFSTYNDLTYPLATQAIITNGNKWSFYGYQMNTTLVHSNEVYDNPKVNYCWGTKELQLFENFDYEKGKCSGLNDEVLKNLLHFYVNAPVARNINMKPYLGENEKVTADITDDDRRNFLETKFKHLFSNRPRHREIPEIYMWERIYKINNKTRPLDPKRRFFELGINPFQRRLNEHTPEYIPKVVRPEGPKSKKKWAKTYWP